MTQQFSHQECMSLLASIRSSPPGGWTHDLHTLSPGPARLVDRVIIPSGTEVVYFRNQAGAGAWPAANWDRFAVLRVAQEPEMEQLTLF